MEANDARQELLAQLMNYCNLSEEDMTEADETQLEEFYLAAVDYLTAAGAPEPSAADTGRHAAWMSLVKALVLDDWDHRGAHVETEVKENRAFRRRLNQLKVTSMTAAQ